MTSLAVESSAGTVAFRGLFELPGGLSCQEPFARVGATGIPPCVYICVPLCGTIDQGASQVLHVPRCPIFHEYNWLL